MNPTHVCPEGQEHRACLEQRMEEIDAELATMLDVNVSEVFNRFREVDFTPTDWASDAVGPAWLVDHILGEDQRTLLVSAAGVGKTWIGLSLGMAVATNSPFAGRATKNERLRPVVMLDEENSPRTVRGRVRAIAQGLRVGIKDYTGAFIHHSQRAFHRGDRQNEALKEYLAEIRPCLLIFDTARRFVIGDENDSAAVAEFWAWVDSLRNAVEGDPVAALVLHHSGHEQARARGSSDWLASPDVILQLAGSMDAALTLSWAKMRDGDPQPAETLRYHKTSSAMILESNGF